MVRYNIKRMESFEKNVKEIFSYISNNLKNPNAALALANLINKAVEQRAKMPKAYKPYTSLGKNKKIYHIKIQNFYSFYYIIESKKQMKLFTFMFSRMSVANIIDKLDEAKPSKKK